MSDLDDLANKIYTLHKEAVKQSLAFCKPEVESIIENNVQDIKTIEQMLDTLLGVAYDDDILILYKNLCRHYYYINKENTAYYVNSYREMWDNEEETENE